MSFTNLRNELDCLRATNDKFNRIYEESEPVRAFIDTCINQANVFTHVNVMLNDFPEQREKMLEQLEEIAQYCRNERTSIQ